MEYYILAQNPNNATKLSYQPTARQHKQHVLPCCDTYTTKLNILVGILAPHIGEGTKSLLVSLTLRPLFGTLVGPSGADHYAVDAIGCSSIRYWSVMSTIAHLHFQPLDVNNCSFDDHVVQCYWVPTLSTKLMCLGWWLR